jgi:hypothetical protein
MADANTPYPGLVGLGRDRQAPAVSKDLQDEFVKAFAQVYGTAPQSDPMLEALFQALASQVARIYRDAEQVFPERVIDDIVDALGLASAAAVPAQTVIAFDEVDVPESIGTDFPLIGFSQTGEQLKFLPDADLRLVPATLRFAAVLEADRLEVVRGATLAGSGAPLAATRLRVDPRRAPLLLLAIEAAGGDLSGLGVHFNLTKLGSPVEGALARSPWQCLDRDGLASDARTLIPRIGRGGLRLLEPITIAGASDTVGQVAPEPSPNETGLPDLPIGPYGPQTFRLPALLETGVQERCAPPAIVQSALARLIPEESRQPFEEGLFWLAIALPAGLTDVASGLREITLNCVTASNLEVLSEMHFFERHGTTLNLRPEGVRSRHVLAVRAVTGERGEVYRHEAELDAPPLAGRFRLERQQLHFRPARSETGREDKYATYSLLVTEGERGNGVDAGRIARLGLKAMNPTLRVHNVLPSRGGTNPPDYARSRVRLAEALRSRDRVITTADFEFLTQAFDARLAEVRVEHEATLVDRRLQTVHVVRCRVRETDLGDPESDAPRLRDRLQRHLQDRALIGQVVRVDLAVTRT